MQITMKYMIFFIIRKMVNSAQYNFLLKKIVWLFYLIMVIINICPMREKDFSTLMHVHTYFSLHMLKSIRVNKVRLSMHWNFLIEALTFSWSSWEMKFLLSNPATGWEMFFNSITTNLQETLLKGMKYSKFILKRLATKTFNGLLFVYFIP